MKLTVETKSFVDAVSWATKNYDGSNKQAYVILGINEDEVGYLSHANGNSYMKSEYAVSSVEFAEDEETDVTIAVDGKFLDRLAKAMGKDGELVISKNLNSDKGSLNVKSKLGNFTVPIVDARIPSAPDVVELGEVDDNDFFDSLSRIAKLCDPANSGSSLFIGSVDLGFDTENNRVTMFATDRYALGQISLDFSASDEDDEVAQELTSKHILLPYTSAVLVPPTKGINTSITLIGDKSAQGGSLRFGYSFPDGRVALFNLSNVAVFEHTEKMKEAALKTVEHSINVKTADLINAIRVVSSLAWGEESIYLHITEDGLLVTDSSSKNSLQVEDNGIDYDSEEEYDVRFLRLTINEAFSAISTSNVSLRWGPNSNAFILAPLTEDGEELDNVFVMAVFGK